VVSTDGAVVNHDIPRPQSNSVPLTQISNCGFVSKMVSAYLFDFKPFPAVRGSVSGSPLCNFGIGLGFRGSRWTGVGHLDISHLESKWPLSHA
jgi:hypothetical protein